MSISKTLYQVVRQVPETDEIGWGAEATAFIDDLIDGVEGLSVLTAAQGVFPRLRTASATPGAASTLTPTAPRMKLSGSGGPVTLNTTTPITNGEFEGQLLELQGTSDVNTVTIQASGNVKLNGDMVLFRYAILGLVWDVAEAAWVERFRSF